MEKVILGKYLLTGDGTLRENWGLAFEGSRIIALGANDDLRKQYSSFNISDSTDKIISPGLVNSHLHSYSLLGRGMTYPPGLNSFAEFLKDFWWPKVEDRIDARMIEISTLVSAVELLNSGVTTFCDVLEAPKALPGALDLQARVLEETGIRAILSIEASERLGSEYGRKLLDENDRFFRNSLSHPLISGMMCVHTTFTCSREFLNKAAEQARKAGAPIQLHLSESVYEPTVCAEKYGIRPAELYQNLNFWGSDVLAAQGVKLSEEELDILADAHVSLSHVPLSNCGFAAGIAPVPEMAARGMTVGLGSDGYINNFFDVMKGAYLLHKGQSEDASVLPGDQVYSMATRDGARAVKMPMTGRLEEGSYADIITLNTDFPTPLNPQNIYDQIILHLSPENVWDVYVNGEIVKEEGRMKKYNMEELTQQSRREAERLWRF